MLVQVLGLNHLAVLENVLNNVNVLGSLEYSLELLLRGTDEQSLGACTFRNSQRWGRRAQIRERRRASVLGQLLTLSSVEDVERVDDFNERDGRV